MVTLGPALGQSAALGSALADYAQHFRPQNVVSVSDRIKAGLAPNLRALFANVRGQLVTWLSRVGAGLAQMGVAWASSIPTILAYVALILSMTGLILGSKAYFKRQVFDVIPTAWQADAEILFGQIDHDARRVRTRHLGHRRRRGRSCSRSACCSWACTTRCRSGCSPR